MSEIYPPLLIIILYIIKCLQLSSHFSFFFFTSSNEHTETLKEKVEEVLAVGSAVVNADVNPIAGTFIDISATCISSLYLRLAITALHSH